MAIRGSSGVIRTMSANVSGTANRLEDISAHINQASRPNDSWDDAKAREFHEMMVRLAALVESPVRTLRTSKPKLDALADIIDRYNSISY